MSVSTADFQALTIGLASPEEIRSWSRGEVKKPETINYRTYRPERDGLFCERIFGPVRDWECHCGKYKKVKFKGIICDRCGVEVTRSKVRRERMGHIELAAPVVHSWYLKGVPSPLSLLLDMSRRTLEEVVYFASYIVTSVDGERLHRRRSDIKAALESEREELRAAAEAAIEELRRRYEEGLAAAAEAEESEADEDAEAEAGPVGMSEEELSRRIQEEQDQTSKRINDLEAAVETLFDLAPKQLISELNYRQLMDLVSVCERQLDADFSDLFSAGLGAEAIYELLEQIDLDEMARELRKEIDEHGGARRLRAVKRLKVVEAFRNSKNRPEWMVLTVLPVLPAELRPMVQLDGGRFATSDLNDLYRRVINRNNRLRRIIEINAPESIVNHERRLLQEAVDALIDNSRRSRPVTGSNRRQLKSLSDMLKGKEGRFRKNLLGKRVDYSGRSVIVVGPELKLHECGLPREMALELFKPFVMHKLVERSHTTNIKTAKRMVDRLEPVVWDALEEVIEGHPVLLNRAPTLHRLGIQAFVPVLIDGKAIQLHPLVCQAFNADFDGDQMAVHVPLSAHAQAEARLLMLASQNLFKPADGQPISQPVYDIVLGAYYMTQESENPPPMDERKYFESAEAVISSYERRMIDLHAPVNVRMPQIKVVAAERSGGDEVEIDPRLRIELERGLVEHLVHEHPLREREVSFTVTKKLMKEVEDLIEDLTPREEEEPSEHLYGEELAAELERALSVIAARGCLLGRCPVGAKLTVTIERKIMPTTVGRVIFNSHLPPDMPFYNHDIAKNQLSDIVVDCYRRYGQERTAELVDTIKELGFQFVTRSGLSICLDDTHIATDKDAIIGRAERDVERVNKAAAEGVIAEDERESSVLARWEQARQEISDNIMGSISSFNSLWMMVNSGARASLSHISQITGMRGLMSDPFGRLIEDLPVKNNLHDGLDLLEYFVSTHGARKGLADTALRTADAGYLTRRLVDVSQDVMVQADDCGTMDGVRVTPMYVHDVYCPACGMVDYHHEGVCKYCGEELPELLDDELYQVLADRIAGRWSCDDIIDPETGEVIIEAQHEIDEMTAQRVEEAGVKEVLVRSPLTCELRRGVCAKCYGRDMATQRLVEVGTAVGIIAAQSVGEPGTQLTMRTFHTGGVAGEYITGVADVKKRKQQALRSLQEDIDQGRVSLEMAGGGRQRRKAIKEMLKVLETSVRGLLRVEELFEARTPKGQAITADVDGVVAEVSQRGMRTVVIHSEHAIDELESVRGERLAEDIMAQDGKSKLASMGEKLLKKVRDRLTKAGIETVKIRTEHLVPYRGDLLVNEGTEVRAGDPLTTGPVDPEKLLAMQGREGVQDYLLREIQRVYRMQHGIRINDKHIETIIRQMLLKVKIIDHGDTRFLPGELVDRFAFQDENERVRELGGQEATAEPVLLGITQASLATESFLSAASFQRTTRVLTEAACENKRDPLHGLKENVIIGRLVPAGSGMPEHRDREVGFSEQVLEALAAAKSDEKSKAAETMRRLMDSMAAGRSGDEGE